ncbi:MAG: type VI secretion system baseplate subunit TssF [Mesorhizobium sp.]|nr:MAG: type VI secretion system baseplate subunit TssF [Mesorhizobium sp.]
MDRVFVEYYEEELTHIRALAAEFADMHPAVARNLSLDTVPCPDPYVERLLDGVAFLAARTRLKVDAERSRFSRAVLDVLYPDLVTPAPATAMAVLKPGQQVQSMIGGHAVARGTRLVSSLHPGLSTRSTFTTAQEITLWPIAITSVSYFQDRSGLAAAGIGPIGGVRGEAGLRIALARTGKGKLSELSLDRLDLYFAGRNKAPLIFDAIFGACSALGARTEGKTNPLTALPEPEMVGIRDDEALMPRTRPTFEGYRLLREYFMIPERFHYVRVSGLQPVVRKCEAGIEIIFLFRRPVPELADVTPSDFELFVTPLINLFERECNVIEIDPRRTRQVLHADRTRARDFEIFRVTRVEDADAEGSEAEIPELFSLGQNRGSGWVYSTERRPRRATEDERRDGLTRTSYTGDDVFLAISRPAGSPANRPLKRLAWRLVAQLSLNFLSLAKEGRGVDPLHALLDLYADRGDPSLARNVHSITRIDSRPVIERLRIDGPMCFGRGTEVTLHVDQSVLAGQSTLLLSALLSRLFARHAGINGFVRTRTRLLQKQEDVPWPMTPGNRYLI